jgi:hypothetical protein
MALLQLHAGQLGKAGERWQPAKLVPTPHTEGSQVSACSSDNSWYAYQGRYLPVA